jgi:outer membrane protein assembly factor BamE
MQKSSVRSDRSPAAAGAFLLALAALLAGCASKNPLIDEPAPAAAQAQPASTPAAAANNDGSSVVASRPTGIYRFLGFLAPHKIDIQQGNFVSREMVAQLEEGMKRPEGVTREQVRFVLGTPLLTDAFHSDRWDYVFRLKKRNGEVISSRVTAFFQDNRLVKIDGDTLPTEKEYLAYIAGTK